MSVPRIPAGLRHDIFERDGFTCRPCGERFPEFCLQVQHLINRAGVDRELYWSPKNLLTVCGICHPKITDGEEGFQRWSVSKFGDQDAALDAFWKALGRDWRIS